jgi:parallel beta-helix repeat protein
VQGAEGEGILAVNPNPVAGPMLGGQQLYTGTPLHDITVEHNIVTKNNVGFNNPASPYVFCTPNGGSDCGGGIHLLSVADSTVRDNTVTWNSDGILLTDEFGPNHDNLIEDNYVAHNTTECGIVLPSHNLGMDPTTGRLDPSFGGVYDNTVVDNVAVDNGTVPYGGSGIGVFAPGSYTASYDNVITRNFIQGNGLAGISVHSHAPNAYVNGNEFTYNVIGTNNVDLMDGTDTVQAKATTGILIWSVTKYHMVVAHNKIFANTYGIWYTPGTVHLRGLHTNRFHAVTTPIFLQP